LSLGFWAFKIISAHPGIHFRELQRRLRLGVGHLAYLLETQLKLGVVKAEKVGEYLRFYPSDFSPDLVRLVGILRVNSYRKIILLLMEKPGSTHKEITAAIRLSPSTVSWHLKRLVSLGIVIQSNSGSKKRYAISDPDKVAHILRSYRESFAENLTNRFYEMWTI